MVKLILPTTYEQARGLLPKDDEVRRETLAQFVQPVTAAEQAIVDISSGMTGGGGRAVLLHGEPGSGKSTFIESLRWRPHLKLPRIVAVDCSEFDPLNPIPELAKWLQAEGKRAAVDGVRTVVTIDYLESLDNIDEGSQKGFFQFLNGLLRKSPLLVVWPVTSRQDAAKMVAVAGSVSNTVFDPGMPILEFSGPDVSAYTAIAENSVAVFNGGHLLQEFMLTSADLDAVRDKLVADPNRRTTIRNYLLAVNEHWEDVSGHLDELRAKLPKPVEVWCVFCHPDAEAVASQFATKTEHVPTAWTAYHARLWEYVPNTQRVADWKSPARLQYAVAGALRTRILFITPQALIAACRAYGNVKIQSLALGGPASWSDKSTAQSMLKTTPVHRQLVGQPPNKGKTKGKPAADARAAAESPFSELNKWLAGSGHDRNVHYAIADVLRAVLPNDYTVVAEQAHPWIPNIIPDVRVDTPDGRQISLEFCYTNKRQPGAVPDYVLDKLATYMDQVEAYAQQ